MIEVAPEEVYQLGGRAVVVLNKGMGLSDCAEGRGRGRGGDRGDEGLLGLVGEGVLVAEVEADLLSVAEGDRGEVGHVRTRLNPFEGDAQGDIISIEGDFSAVKVNHGAYDITRGPFLTICRAVVIPLFDSVAVVRVRCAVIADTAIVHEGCRECAPADLHDAIAHYLHLVVIAA